MGLVDYHIHTPLCGHAAGEPEEYVASALERGLSEIGFSDHAPLPDGLREGITMTISDTEDYIARIGKLQNAFRGRIAIRTGFEVDFPLTNSFDRRYLTDGRIDYLIGSCHFIDGWPFDHPDFADEFNRRDIDEVYGRYFELMGGLVESGHFNIIGHFDLVKKFGHRATRDFSGAISAMFARVPRDCAVEINTAGLRKPVREIYPSRAITELFFTLNVPVTLGSDSHDPVEVGFEFARALEMLKDAGYRKISGFEKRRRFDIAL